ncbi:LysR family transcriptional regulator [Variovorax terrae]|uniref:LysR family transcriptional regulator n=1 Tax=Variovorax terrae TaxID=2923278 RepID=A0A9X1VSV5_9BURK|nr:LysR family transcriptional regulator [Variovorax terrae]MCJ0762703.1 LysR family transcriptional regulator [Variovorax terrae]
MDHRHLDVYLLRCLQALVSEAHVTRAAERMGIGQPAMSATLARLRVLFADPLLVRTQKGMVATPRAQEVADQVQHALELIDQALTEGAPFDPARARAHFRIAASESVGFLLMPALIARLRACAPAVQVSVHPPELPRVRQELEEGEADLVVAFLRNAPQGLRSTSLMQQKLCVIAAQDHPDIRGTLSLAQYVGSPHAMYALGRTGGSTIETLVDETLSRAGMVRAIGARLPSTLSSPAVVAGSDLLATIPERIARHFAQQLALQVLAPPLPLDDVHTSMFWHERMQNNPAHRWLRQQFKQVAAPLAAP